MRSVTAWFKRYALQLIVLLIVVVAMYALYPNFRPEAAIERLIPLGVIAAGLAVTMIAGEFDLSIASMAALAGAITVALSGLGLVVSLLIAIVVCTLLGIVQGWAIAKLGINSLVFTVGTLVLLRGLTWLVCGGLSISVEDIAASDIFSGKFLFLSPLSTIAILILIALGVFLARTRWGRELYALGSSRHEAIAAGVRYKRGMVIAFGISAGCGAVGGALTSAVSGSAAPTALEPMLVLGIAAALVGGISIAGGRGTMVNVFLGFAIISVLASGLAAMGSKAFVAQLFTGIFLLLIVLAEYVIQRVSERHRRTRTKRVLEEQQELAAV
ncbi:ABC transporter permease [Herbiconiux sp.]|uniref:ABC transporter permease n=1 Tax=Herbiconiux sp. TaxID=1871186 RepID=UPI0025C61270|nr:ABC transporter permease [Herbiconiux sp.]